MWTRLAKVFTWIGVAIFVAGFVVVWFKPSVGFGVILLGVITVARAATLVDHWKPPRWR
jgi:hypothetical protein